ncbi:MAG TPA: peptidase M19 [Planctomycetaceae bacterium]|nr:peptidase M19 [Planctomycetaceae bacterium]
MLIFDAHLDISMNAVQWNRDITKSIDHVRDREMGMTDYLDRGKGVLTLEEMRKGEIGLCIATQIGRYVAPDNPLPGWNSPEIAWSITQAQLAWYRLMEEQGQMLQITTADQLNAHTETWQTSDDKSELPIGYVLSLEGADSIITPAYLERAYEYGLRAIGPAHYGPGRYAPGTGSEGGLEAPARELLEEMERLGIAMDCTHLTDESFWEALEIYSGPVWASHNNCRALVPHQRQFSDDQLKALIERKAVVGMAFDAWMMHPGWQRGITQPYTAGVNLARIVEHVDHICQLAGNTDHVGIGSDLDGGFGREQCPYDMETIADLQSLVGILAQRGYATDDIEAIMHGNWIRRLTEIWS